MAAALASRALASGVGSRPRVTRNTNRRGARVVRRAVDDAAVEVVASPPSAAVGATEEVAAETASHVNASEDANAPLKRRVLSLAAASGRGLDATAAQKKAMETVLGDLVGRNPTPSPTSSPLMNGDWELVYSDTFLFRSSPFFWAVGRLMGPNNADFFYAAHDHQTGMFGGGVGRVIQSVDLEGGRFVSDCIVKASLGVPLLGFSPVFAGFGSVITAGRVSAADGVRLAVTAETTTVRQDDATVLPQLNFLNGTSVPVEDVMRQVGGGAAPEVYLDTVYLDDELRVSKLEDGSVFVYQRA